MCIHTGLLYTSVTLKEACCLVSMFVFINTILLGTVGCHASCRICLSPGSFSMCNIEEKATGERVWRVFVADDNSRVPESWRVQGRTRARKLFFEIKNLSKTRYSRTSSFSDFSRVKVLDAPHCVGATARSQKLLSTTSASRENQKITLHRQPPKVGQNVLTISQKSSPIFILKSSNFLFSFSLISSRVSFPMMYDLRRFSSRKSSAAHRDVGRCRDNNLQRN